MSTTRYWWRAAGRQSWRQALLLALLCGLLGAVALSAVAGARRTSTAYDRYLTSIRASDVLVNVPGKLPAEPILRPIRLISGLPGITSAATYIGLSAAPYVGGHFDLASAVGRTLGSLDGEFFQQDRMSVLAGRLPPPEATGQVVLTPDVARELGAHVGRRVSYGFQRLDAANRPAGKPFIKSYRVAAIALVPPVLVDSTDRQVASILPPGATRQVLSAYGYAWVAVRLARGTAGIPALQHELAGLGDHMQQRENLLTHHNGHGLSFDIQRSDTTRGQVRASIQPQVVALYVFGGIAALALLALAGQGLVQLASRSAPEVSVLRLLGATRGQAALAASLPGLITVAGGLALSVAGAVALSPLAPIGPVRGFDPDRGVRADGLVLGAGGALLAVILLGLLGVLVRRSSRPPHAEPAAVPVSKAVLAAARAGLPPTAVIGGRNALEAGPRARAVPVRTTLLGCVTAVTLAVTAVVFGASLTGLVSHPARYGWNWDLVIQSQGGFGPFLPGRMQQLISGQPAVAGWSELSFAQLPVDGRTVPVMAIRRDLGAVQPLTTGGQPLGTGDQIQLGAATLRELGKKIGDTVRAGPPGSARTLVITGTVTLPSFGLNTGDHVSLGRGAMLPLGTLYAIEGKRPGPLTRRSAEALNLPTAVAIDLAPGTTPAQRAQLIHRIAAARPDGAPPGNTYELPTAQASAVLNARALGGQPLALALGLAAAAALSLALTVLASVRRHRRELALLKTLGMTRAQLRAVVAWQTSLTLLITMAVGLPLGIAAGRWAWHGFAGSIGTVPVTDVPVLVLILGVVAVATTGNLLAAVPASIAARTRAAALLRAP